MSRPTDFAASTPRTTTLVVCLGNEFRGDDAFGLVVAQRLGDGLAGARVIAHRGDALSLLDAWRGFDHVIFVDTAAVASPPGTIFEIDVSGAPAPLELGGTSTHALGPGGVIELARALGELPERVRVVAVAGREFTVGTPMSPPVADRVETIVERIRTLIGGRAAE